MMLKNKSVTFVIVLYKSEHVIEQCLKYLTKYPVIIIDNSVNKKLRNKLLLKFKNIQNYILPSKNLGFSAGNNLGAKYVKTEYIYFISPDIFFKTDKLSNLLDEFNINKKIGIITPALIDKNQNILKNKNFFPEKEFKHNQNNYWVWGCSILIKKKVFIKIKGFDEIFFIYYSDVDICKKIYLEKLKIKEVKYIKVIHLVANSSKLSFFDNMISQISHKYSFYLYLKKYRILKINILIINFFDYFQRMIKNLLLLRFRKFFKNFLRIVAIFKFLFYLVRYS